MEEQASNLGLTADLPNNLTSSQTVLPRARQAWLSTSIYLLIVLAISGGLFFLIWFLFHDEENDNDWIPATTAAGLFLVIAMVSREIVLRRAQTRQLLSQQHNLGFPILPRKTSRAKKFTLEQNAAALQLIQKKSGAAAAIDATPESHLEIFRLCQNYLDFISAELKIIRAGSPRLPALKKGFEQVSVWHKRHLLDWAAGETYNLTREAAIKTKAKDKIEMAQRALEVLNSALLIYPTEAKLIDSIALVREFIVSTQIADYVEAAERAEFKGYYKRAIDRYKDALFYLARETNREPEQTGIVVNRLNAEIDRLQTLAKQKKQVKN